MVTFKSTVKYIRQYCCTSTIHGLNHIVNSRTLLEKCLWIALFLTSLYYGWSLSMATVIRYINNPVVISIERDKFSWTTPLPGNLFTCLILKKHDCLLKRSPYARLMI